MAVLTFDPEGIEGGGPDEPNSYYAIISQLAEASCGLFTPTEISDELDEDEEVARIAFTHHGKRVRQNATVIY